MFSSRRLTKKGISFSAAFSIVLSGVFLVPLAIDRTPAVALAEPDLGSGLTGHYQNNSTIDYDEEFTPFRSGFDGAKTGLRPFFSSYKDDNFPSPNENNVLTWFEGYIYLPVEGNYEFASENDDGFVVEVDGERVIESWSGQGDKKWNDTGNATLTQSVARFEAWHHENIGGEVAKLYWKYEGMSCAETTTSDGYCPIPKTSYFADQLDTPSGLAATASGEKSIDVSWDNVSDAGSYVVRLYGSTGNSLLATKTGISGNSTTLTTSDYGSFLDNTQYRVSVQAVVTSNTVADGNESAKVSVTTAGANSITWDVNGGTLTPAPPSNFYDGGSIQQPTEPTRTGFHFIGWSTSESNNNGVVSDVVSWPYSPGVTQNITLYASWGKKDDYALEFDSSTIFASGNYQVIPDGNNFTFETWLNPGTESSFRTIVYQGADNTERFAIYYLNRENIHIGRANESTDVPVGDISGQWSHLAVTVNSSNLVSTYLNGQLLSEVTLDPRGSLPSADFRLGAREAGNSGNRFDGQLDQVKVWDGVLTADEVESSMHSWGKPADVNKTLRAHYDFNDNTQASVLRDMYGDNDLSISKTGDFKSLVERPSRTGYEVYKFIRSYLTANGGWSLSDGINELTDAELVIAGGGGGGAGADSDSYPKGGGGGAGGNLFFDDDFDSNDNLFSVVVGAGGFGGDGGSNPTAGAAGQKSKFGSIFKNGGGGGNAPTDRGGAGGDTSVEINGASEDFSGGTNPNNWEGAGGGAGAAGDGSNVSTSDDIPAQGQGGATGGAARQFSNLLSDSSDTYLAGGGGGGSGLASGNAHDDKTSPKSGGNGAGAGGGSSTSGIVIATSALPNRAGGGGGGAGSENASENSGGNGGSGVVILAYPTASITSSGPSNQSALSTQTATFTVSTTGTQGTPSYQWQVSTNGGSSWSNVSGGSGATTAEYTTPTLQTSDNGKQYRVLITSTLNGTTTGPTPTSAATLTVNDIFDESLVLHYNASDTNSYDPSSDASSITDLAGNYDGSVIDGEGSSVSLEEQSFRFSGSDGDYIQAADFVNQDFTNGATFDFIAKFEATSSAYPARIISSGTPDLLIISSTYTGTGNGTSPGFITLEYRHGNGEVMKRKFTDAIPDDGQFHRYTIVSSATDDPDGTRVPSRLYVDGVLHGTSSFMDSFDGPEYPNTSFSSSDFFIGNVQSIRGLNGYLRHLQIFNRAFTESQLSDINVSYNTVTFDSNGGTDPADLITSGTINLPSPGNIADSTFAGWYVDEDFSSSLGVAGADYTPGDTSLHALWNHDITWDANGGTLAGGEAATFPTNGTIAEPSDPNRSGFNFLGWSTSETGNNGDSGNEITSWDYSPGVNTDVTLYAIWEASIAITTPTTGLSGTVDEAYSLNISASGGTGGNTFTATGLGSGLSINSSTGEISGTPTADGSLTVAVTVEDDDGNTATTSSVTISIAKKTLANSSAPTVSAPAGQLKQIFASWDAVANASSYTVIVYDSAGTSDLATITEVSGTSTTITVSQFGAIADDTEYKVSVTAVGTGNYVSGAESALSAAVRTNKTYTVTFKAGDNGTGSDQTDTKVTGATLVLPDSDTANGWFTRAGYSVSGFATNSDGTGTSYAFGSNYTADANDDLFAVWEAIVVEASGDTYVNPGNSSTVFGNDSVILMKNAGPTTRFTRVGYIEFNYDPNFVWDGAALELAVAGNDGGKFPIGYNTTFTTFNVDVYAFNDASWDESTMDFDVVNATNQDWGLDNSNPFVPDGGTKIGTIGIPTLGSTVGKTFSISNSLLDTFLNNDADGNVTFYIQRSDTDNEANLSFATKENNDYHGPRLVVASAGYEYRISYDINGGSGNIPSSGVYTEGGSAYPIEATTGITPPTGKRIVGWNTQADGNGTDYAAGDSYNTEESLTLYAKYVDNSFTITFNAGDDGTGSEQTLTKNFGTNLTLPNSATANGWFTREGYTLTSWSENADGSTSDFALGAAYSTESADTFYPVWTANDNTVTFKANYDSGPSDKAQTITTDQATALNQSFTRTGYDPNGWNTEADGSGTSYTLTETVTITGDLILHAQWTAATYTLTYNYNSATGGNDDSSATFTTGTAPITLPTPTRTGYTFDGWYLDNGFSGLALGASLTLTEDDDVYAKWSANAYTVIYDYNGADGSNTTTDDEYTTDDSDTEITLPTPTRTGFNFGGWYEASDFSGSAVTSPYTTSANRTIYAKWNAINYSVTYNTTNADSGSAPTDSTNYNIGDSVSVAGNSGNLVRAGYVFGGWALNSSGTGTIYGAGEKITVASADIDLYPKWNPGTYTITYSANGGTGSPASATDTFTTGDSALTLTGEGTLVKTGYSFLGWNASPEGTTALGGYTTNQDVTLYAVWELVEYDLIYYLNGGSGTAPTTQSANITETVTVSGIGSATKTGHWFAGWNSESDGSGTSYAPGTTTSIPVGDETIYAIWVPNEYKIYYNANGGTGGPDLSATNGFDVATFGSSYNIRPKGNIARVGHQFNHWTTNADGTGNKYDEAQDVIGELTSFTPTQNTTFYAQWSKVSYSLSFVNPDGSASIGTQTRTFGQNLTMPSAGSRTGYTFAGWSDGSVVYPQGSTYNVAAANKVFTATWIPDVYTISYDWQGGSGTPVTSSSFLSYTVGTGNMTLPTVGDFTRDGFEFAGWAETAGGSIVSDYQPDSDQVLYAVWSNGNFALTFDLNGGTGVATSAMVPRTESRTLPTPNRAGFVFTGWYTADSGGSKIGNAGASFTPASSRTSHARWVQRSLFGVDEATLENASSTLTATGPGGSPQLGSISSGSTSASISVPAGALPAGTVVNAKYFKDTVRQSALIPGDNNYFFSVLVSWLNGSGDSATVPDTDPDIPVSVTLNNTAIKAGARIYQVIGDQVTDLGVATQDGTVTVELYEDPEIVVASTKPDAPTAVSGVSGNTEVTVSWTAPASNGGAAITGYTVTSSGGQTCTTATTSCTVTGLTNGSSYTFTVTATNSVGTSSASSASASVTPALATYVVTYNSNGGSSVGNGSFADGGSIASAPADPTRSGFSFAGWSTTKDDASTKVTFPYTPGVSSNITLYALWTAVQSGGSGDTGGSGGFTPAPDPVTPESVPGRTPEDSKIGFVPSVPSGDGPTASQAGVRFRTDAPKETLIADGGSWNIQLKPELTVSETVTEALSLRSKVTGNVELIATGLRANSYLEIWAFSDPVFIAEVETDNLGRITSEIELPENLLPGEHTLQIGTLNSSGSLITVNIPITVEGQVTVGTFKGYIAIYTKDLEGQRLSAKVAGKWLVQDPIDTFKDFGYSRVVRFTGAGYDILVDVYINRQFFERTTTRTR